MTKTTRPATLTTSSGSKPLTSKELDRVYSWAEEHENDNPLAETYIGMCIAVGYCNNENLCRFFHKTRAVKAVKIPIATAFGIKNRLIKERDFVGRIILKYLEAE